ncbi:hypothetical protein V6N11_043240 [Hibiscus sabdariffa]|uniref:Uncharacterized protein n=1 Tax=Hibiscus sabdariffa TaxID=183260 RepID=A0ABR2QYS8_9ROSI
MAEICFSKAIMTFVVAIVLSVATTVSAQGSEPLLPRHRRPELRSPCRSPGWTLKHLESRLNSTVLVGPRHLEVAWSVGPALRPWEAGLAGLSWTTRSLVEREVLHEMMGSTSSPRGGEFLPLSCLHERDGMHEADVARVHLATLRW